MIWRETVENHGVKIRAPIDLAQLICGARKDGLSYEVWPLEEGQRFEVLVDPERGGHEKSLYFSDGNPVFYHISDGTQVIRGVVTFDSCTFEAELRNGQLIISTNMTSRVRRRFLERIEKW